MLRIGPSGNSESFYAAGYKHTFEAAAWLHGMGLNAYEYSFGRGVSIGDASAEKVRGEFSRYGIEISVHAPYYTNFANPSPEMIEKSIGYIKQSIEAVGKLGGKRVVFHPAACGKAERREAVSVASDNIRKMMSDIDGSFILCPETMGKHNQIGTVEETVEFCKTDERLVPCFDFGHINSYTQGGIRGYDDYKRIIDYTINTLGRERANKLHIHFSKIMYGNMGEIKHLTFADETYGPEYVPLAKLIDDYKLDDLFIVCESRGTMAEDALAMKNMHKN